MARGKITFTDEQRSFLLSPEAQRLTPRDADLLKPDEAYERFKAIRWSLTDGEPACPHCGSECPYELSTRSRFKCWKCGRQFSATSGTIFASRKLPFETILKAISIKLHAPQNVLAAAGALKVNYRTAWSLSQRFKTFGVAPAGNIQPKTSDGRWPFLLGAVDNGETLLSKVNKAVPKGLPEQIRADVAQDLILGVLSGEITEDELAGSVRSYVSRHRRLCEQEYDLVSIDGPIFGTDGLRLIDRLTEDNLPWAG